jgi:phage terminase large subunit-like protein
MNPSEISTLIEEGLLMAFTVIFAVWSLTTFTVRDGKRLISENASLPLGISFGYAYAGSVAMLTGTFDSLREVMIFGHVLTICAMILLLRPTLRASRISSDIFATAKSINISDIEEKEETEEETEEETDEESTDEEEVWQEDEEVNWEEGKDISEGTEWQDEDSDVELAD